MSEKNLDLWDKVSKTDPNFTKKAKVGGNSITAIDPHYQIKNATKQFGTYGKDWGFKAISLDYSLTTTPITLSHTDYHTKVVSSNSTILGLVVFKAVFFYPSGEFPIINSIKIFMDKAHNSIDDNFAKKVETDSLTKALSKLGFNADVFLGLYDDERYVSELKDEFKTLSTLEKGTPEWDNIVDLVNKSSLIQVQQIEKMHTVSSELMKELVAMMKKVIEDKKKPLTEKLYEKAKTSEVKSSIQTLLTKYRMTDEQRKTLKEQIKKLK